MVVFETLGSFLPSVMYIIHITCTVQEIKTYKIESIFLDHAVYLEIDATIDVI